MCAAPEEAAVSCRLPKGSVKSSDAIWARGCVLDEWVAAHKTPYAASASAATPE